MIIWRCMSKNYDDRVDHRQRLMILWRTVNFTGIGKLYNSVTKAFAIVCTNDYWFTGIFHKFEVMKDLYTINIVSSIKLSFLFDSLRCFKIILNFQIFLSFLSVSISSVLIARSFLTSYFDFFKLHLEFALQSIV